MKKRFSKELIIGLSVIIAIVILVTGIDFLKGVNLFKPSNYYIVEFNNVAGLEKAAAVTIDGYKVGQVSEINFNYAVPGKVEVELALDKDLRIPKDSRADMGSALMGGSFVQLHLGQSKEMLPVGGHIQGQAGSDLMSTLNQNLVPQVGSAVERLDTLLSNLNRLTGDPALIRSMQRLDGITYHLLATSQNLNHSTANDLPVIMHNIKDLTVKTDTIAYNLSVLSRQLRDLPLHPTLDNINSVVSNLETFSRQLNDKKSTIGKMMNDPELYDRLNRTAADVDSLILDIKQNPKRYINIKVF